jgi:hypothetical protein
MLAIGDDGDRAVIGSSQVLFVEIERALRKLHEIGKQMLDGERIRPATQGGEATDGVQGDESLAE